MTEPTRHVSSAERVLKSGLIQAYITDVGCVAGLGLIGAGIRQLSVPGMWIYAGVVVLGVSVLLALSRRPVKPKE